MNAYEVAVERIDSALRQRHRAGKLGPGASLALTTRDRLLATRAYGVAHVHTREPVDETTLFQIGSITKHFTAVACLRLHEEGLLDLHAPVTDVLDWFEVASGYETPLTIHHLLTHTGGLVMMNDCFPSSWWQAWSLRDTRLGFEPGTKFSYSNVGYNVLQCILQTVTGQPFGELLRTTVFAPLGMNDTWGEVRTEQLPRMARGHKSSYHDDRPASISERQVPVNWYEMSAGCASVVTTPADLSRFLRMLLRRGVADDGRRLLSEEAFETMIHPYVDVEGFFEGTSQGYGLLIERSDDTGGTQRIIGGGENLGYEAAMYGDCETGLGVILFNNSLDICWSDVRHAMSELICASHGDVPPEMPGPSADDPTNMEDRACPYAGEYCGTDRSFTVTDNEGRVEMVCDGTVAVLEPIYGDCFVTGHPAFEHAMLSFGRDDSSDVVEAFSLGDWFRNRRYRGPTEFATPGDWDAYIGKYRSFGILVTSFRIFARKGTLFRQAFGGYVDEPLTDLGGGSFRVGDDTSPEILTFDALAGGRALRCRVAGGAFFRVDDP